ncbi:MAG: homeobox domain-containing protein [Oligoflexia bacterium]|nr:homeobox domain-containing protein [Oligoflexia bacterium]
MSLFFFRTITLMILSSFSILNAWSASEDFSDALGVGVGENYLAGYMPPLSPLSFPETSDVWSELPPVMFSDFQLPPSPPSPTLPEFGDGFQASPSVAFSDFQLPPSPPSPPSPTLPESSDVFQASPSVAFSDFQPTLPSALPRPSDAQPTLPSLSTSITSTFAGADQHVLNLARSIPPSVIGRTLVTNAGEVSPENLAEVIVNNMTFEQLIDLCRKDNLQLTGSAEELANRLLLEKSLIQQVTLAIHNQMRSPTSAAILISKEVIIQALSTTLPPSISPDLPHALLPVYHELQYLSVTRDISLDATACLRGTLDFLVYFYTTEVREQIFHDLNLALFNKMQQIRPNILYSLLKKKFAVSPSLPSAASVAMAVYPEPSAAVSAAASNVQPALAEVAQHELNGPNLVNHSAEPGQSIPSSIVGETLIALAEEVSPENLAEAIVNNITLEQLAHLCIDHLQITGSVEEVSNRLLFNSQLIQQVTLLINNQMRLVASAPTFLTFEVMVQALTNVEYQILLNSGTSVTTEYQTVLRAGVTELLSFMMRPDLAVNQSSFVVITSVFYNKVQQIALETLYSFLQKRLTDMALYVSRLGHPQSSSADLAIVSSSSGGAAGAALPSVATPISTTDIGSSSSSGRHRHGDEKEHEGPSSKRLRKTMVTNRVPLTTAARNKLKLWFSAHVMHPYPSTEEYRILAKDTQLTLKQVADWFFNVRKRQWQSQLEKAKAIYPNDPVSAQALIRKNWKWLKNE